MIILGIETSCDETALSLIEAKESAGGKKDAGADAPSFTVLGNVLISQTKIHEQYGGVFPMVAKREHAKNLTPLLHKLLAETGMLREKSAGGKSAGEKAAQKNHDDSNLRQTLKKILVKEQGMADQLGDFLQKVARPEKEGADKSTISAISAISAIDAIAVTSGPGLEPALWVGLNFARALGMAWNIPVAPVNHMEGHIVASMLNMNTPVKKLAPLKPLVTPALALLISGGHTELVLIEKWRTYRLIGMTRDDAVGEAFDKVARLLGLPYPGGPEISRLAEEARAEEYRAKKTTKSEVQNAEHSENNEHNPNPADVISLPRPMINSDDYDFSFSGLKTAVLYLIKKLSGNATGTANGDAKKISSVKQISEETKRRIAREFEDAVTETLIAKTEKALEQFSVQTFVIGGGVIANKHIRAQFEKLAAARGLTLYLPDANLATDNAIMIALAGYFVCHAGGAIAPSALMETSGISARGNLSLSL